MRILLTGATGLVGNAVYERLEKNYNVIATSSRNLNLLTENLVDHFTGIDIDVIIHCAAKIPMSQTSPQIDQIAQANSKMDNGIIAFAKHKSSKLIFMSSTSVYGVLDHKHISEITDINSTNPYSVGKYETECAITSEMQRYNIFRLSSPYGSKQQNQTVMKIFVDSALNGREIKYHGSGKRTQDFIHVNDIAGAVEAALETEIAGVYNICSGRETSMKDLANLVSDCALEVLNQRILVTPSDMDDIQENVRMKFDISKAFTELVWEPQVDIKEAIKDWLRERSGIS